MGVAWYHAHTFAESAYAVQTYPSCTHNITYVGDEDWNSLEHSLVHATWGRGHGQVWDTEQPHRQQDWSAETEFVEEELEMDVHLQNKNTNI